ncbi:MAG: response regulator transcription factor [Ilumatobacteraceae bacterium]|jgi:DNA-binding response OmpR family regulator|nr:response regulator transcription factor [Ilumatobacteraceae bacterium]
MARILIVEDEAGIASFLESGLGAAGHTTMVVADGREGAAIARDDAFDLVLLDLGLPGLDGMSALRQIRARGETLPVIILTARGELDTTITGFRDGADDYVTKPFRFEELLARITVRLDDGARRSRGAGTSTIEVGPCQLDTGARTISVDGRVVDLSNREYALALVFFEHPGQVLTREQLLSRVWGYDFDPGSNVVDVYVGYLRKKLPAGMIETVRGAGYRLRSSVE